MINIKKLITPLFLTALVVFFYQGGWYLLNHDTGGGKKPGEEIVQAINEFYHLTILTYAFLGLMASLVLRLIIKKQNTLIKVEFIILSLVAIWLLFSDLIW